MYNLPRAGFYTAGMWHPVFQRVGPGWRSSRHRGVIVEPIPREIIVFKTIPRGNMRNQKC